MATRRQLNRITKIAKEIWDDKSRKKARPMKKATRLRMEKILADQEQDDLEGAGLIETKKKKQNINGMLEGMLGKKRKKKGLPETLETIWEGKYDKKTTIRTVDREEIKTLFDQAKALVYGDRQADYGDFMDGYANAIDMYAAWKRGVGNRHSQSCYIESVADLMMMMVFIKLYRESNKHKVDNIVDAIGYLEMYSRAKEAGR